jgi:hypothetical protein
MLGLFVFHLLNLLPLFLLFSLILYSWRSRTFEHCYLYILFIFLYFHFHTIVISFISFYSFLCKDLFLFSIILWFFVMLSVSLTLFTYRSLSFFCSLLPCGSVALYSSSCWVFRQQHKSLLTYFSPSIMLLVTTLDSFFWFSYFIYFPLLFFLLFGMNFIFDP